VEGFDDWEESTQTRPPAVQWSEQNRSMLGNWIRANGGTYPGDVVLNQLMVWGPTFAAMYVVLTKDETGLRHQASEEDRVIVRLGEMAAGVKGVGILVRKLQGAAMEEVVERLFLTTNLLPWQHVWIMTYQFALSLTTLTVIAGLKEIEFRRLLTSFQPPEDCDDANPVVVAMCKGNVRMEQARQAFEDWDQQVAWWEYKECIGNAAGRGEVYDVQWINGPVAGRGKHHRP
jgi:hypothetical protein